MLYVSAIQQLCTCITLCCYPCVHIVCIYLMSLRTKKGLVVLSLASRACFWDWPVTYRMRIIMPNTLLPVVGETIGDSQRTQCQYNTPPPPIITSYPLQSPNEMSHIYSHACLGIIAGMVGNMGLRLTAFSMNSRREVVLRLSSPQ